jgi:hypothetical protein
VLFGLTACCPLPVSDFQRPMLARQDLNQLEFPQFDVIITCKYLTIMRILSFSGEPRCRFAPTLPQ